MKNSRLIGPLAVAAAPLILGGCGMPLSVTIASIFADGISLAATEKTITDHGISLVAQKDCAVWRGLTEGELCRDEAVDPDTIVAEVPEDEEDLGNNDVAVTPQAPEAEDSDTVLAELPAETDGEGGDPTDAGVESPALTAQRPALPMDHTTVEPAPTEEADTEEKPEGAADGTPAAGEPKFDLASMETAAGADDGTPLTVIEPVTSPVATEALPPPPPSVPEVADTAPLPPLPVSEPEPEPMVVAKSANHDSVAPLPESIPVSETVAKPKPQTFHLVIASFNKVWYADRMVAKNPRLSPRVVTGTAKGRKVYRVVVGPLEPGDRKAAKRRLARAGFSGVWGLNVNGYDPEPLLAQAD